MDRHKKINCILLGGEPTVSPFLKEAIDMLHSRGHTISLTSNGVRSVDYWKEIAPKVNNVAFSYHPSYGIENFFEKVEAIGQHTIIGVRVMFDSRHWDTALNFYKQCLAIPYLRVEAVRVLPEIANGNTVGAEYTPEQLEWLASQPSRRIPDQYRTALQQKNPKWKQMYMGSSFYYDDGSVDAHGDPNHLISLDQSFFSGWACSIGIESLYINWDGQVRKGNCRQGLNLFHLNDHAAHPLPSTGELCIIDRCTCPTDILVTKFPVNKQSVAKPRYIPLVPE